jgi:flagellar basal-body rod protein FlgB
LDTANIPLLRAIQQRMGYLNAQQRTISENLANSDTPGYKAREVAEPDFSNILAQTGARASGRVAVSRPGISAPDAFGQFGSRVASREERQKKVFETKPTGNTVIVEEQLIKMADVQIEYATLTNLYRKQMNLVRTALGKSR